MRVAPERIVVVGAGAIGASVGALLFETGVSCVLVARGEHGRALAAAGVALRFPGRARVIRVPTVASLVDASPTPRDLVVVATMGHDTARALDGIDPAITVASFQNGVAPLETIADRGHPTLAAMVYVPAERREPGVIALPGVPAVGAVLVGAWPKGEGACTRWLVERLASAGFRAEREADVGPWIRAKLLVNLGGILAAVCDAPLEDIAAAARDEARAVFRALGERFEEIDALLERIGPIELASVDGRARVGGSTRSALARGDGLLETGTLHGSIVTRGRAAGIPTPVNEALVRLAHDAVRGRWRPGALDAETVRAAVRC